MKKHLLTFIALYCLSALAMGYETILVKQNYINIDIAKYSDYLNISDENYSVQQVIQPSIQRQFAPVHGDTLQYNQLATSTWLRFAVNNPTGRPVHLYLTIEAPYVELVELYYNYRENAGFQRISTGGGIAYRSRPYQLGNFVLPLEIQTGQQEVLINIKPLQATNIQLRLIDENSLLHKTRAQVQFNTLVASVLLFAIAIVIINFFRYRITITLWTALLILGSALNLSGWNGSIAWWFTNIPMVEVAANNVGVFLTLMSLAHILVQVRNDANSSWLSDAVIWLSRFIGALVVVSFLPLTTYLLNLQVIIVPVALTLITMYWFEQKPTSNAERLAMLGFILILIYYLSTTLIFTGLLSAFGINLVIMSLLNVSSSLLFCWAGWLAAKSKGARIAVEGMVIPDVHWPLLRKLNHQIRGPINGVLGMAELLQDTTLSAHQHEYVNTVQTAGFSLLREADQLQNLIRIGLNRLPENEDEFDLYDLIEDTVQPFSRIAHSKQLELVLDIAQELPSRYRGNAHIISQILSNLLDNALQYTHHGEVLIQVKPWQNHRLRFSITDTGPGIPKDNRGQLFIFPDPHDEQRQQPKDVHLGLPISKYLVGLIGGQLSLSSELRMGTTFWIDLPLQPVQGDEQQADDDHGLGLDELRLMVVDDNLTCRKVIEHLAMSWDSEVLSMSNGQSALANLHNQFHKGEAIDVLILDQNMPSMTGLELAQRIRQDASLNQDIVIIIMTGADDISAEFSDNEAGIEYVMSKPVSARALKQTLAMAMPKIKKNREKYNAKNSFFF